MAGLAVRQTQDRLLAISNDNADTSGKQVEAKLKRGEELTIVGSSQGAPVGDKITINLSFAPGEVGVGFYMLFVCTDDRVIFPIDDTTFTVRVLESC
jgi:hypothetical protein